jgi:alpha-beta hydrolase superfamily lysophospholipase
MTLITKRPAAAHWTEPEGIAPRGTLVLIPGRGESPELYERFGRRISGDGYRVHAVADPVADPALATSQVLAVQADVRPYVLIGSDTGALFAAGLVASGQVTAADALVLAGLPAPPESTAEPTAEGPTAEGPTGSGGQAASDAPPFDSWEAELAARTACPTHRGRLAGQGLRRGALYEPVPSGWESLADLGRIEQPVLALHGAADPVSALTDARERYAQAPRAELTSIAGGLHDVLNDVTHRTVAATIVLFLERLRLGADLAPIAISEKL